MALKSRCEQRPGFCCGDPACPDNHCPGRPLGLEAALPAAFTAPPERKPIVIDWRRARWYLLALAVVVWLVVSNWKAAS